MMTLPPSHTFSHLAYFCLENIESSSGPSSVYDEDSRAASEEGPDISSWTVEQVSQHFLDLGYTHEAEQMRKHVSN